MSESSGHTATAETRLETPLYTPWDAARYLRVPIWWTLVAVDQHHRLFDPDWFFHHFWRHWPRCRFTEDDAHLDPDHPAGKVRVSFRKLAELFVLSFPFQRGTELSEFLPRPAGPFPDNWLRLWDRIPAGKLSFDESQTDSTLDQLVEGFAKDVPEPVCHLLRKNAARRLDRVESEGGEPIRLFPFTREPIENSTRLIVIDPLRRFGRPTVVGRGIPTDVLFERHQAGDSVAALAEDYDIPAEEVEEAIRYETPAPADWLPWID